MVSTQPPWSTATSTITAPCFICATRSRVTSTGARAPGTSTAPITRSASSTACSRFTTFEYRVEMPPW